MEATARTCTFALVAEVVFEDGQLSLAAADAIVAGKHAEEDEHQAETAVQSGSFRSTVYKRKERSAHTQDEE
jgi:hypothetical protein